MRKKRKKKGSIPKYNETSHPAGGNHGGPMFNSFAAGCVAVALETVREDSVAAGRCRNLFCLLGGCRCDRLSTAFRARRGTHWPETVGGLIIVWPCSS